MLITLHDIGYSRKPMSYNKKYTKKEAKTTSILVKTDVVRYTTTSILKKPMLNYVF